MRRPRFSLFALFVGMTLCGVCCGAVNFACLHERVKAPTGSGRFIHCGSLVIGSVDWAGDDRGRMVGIWVTVHRETGDTIGVMEQHPVLVVELSQ